MVECRFWVPFVGAMAGCHGNHGGVPCPKTCDVLYFDLDRLENLFTTPRYR